MTKTLYLSEAIEIKDNDKYIFKAPYVFYQGGKWREDVWYFNNRNEIITKAKQQNYSIV